MKKVLLLIALASLGLLSLMLVSCGTNSGGSVTTTSTGVTTSTVPLTGRVLYGNIQNYHGNSNTIEVIVFTNFAQDVQPVTAEMVSATSLPITYVITMESAGHYFLVAADFDPNNVVPAVGKYIGGSGWTGTDSVEVAGSAQGMQIAITAHTQSVEVLSAPVNASIYMHQVIEAPLALSGIFTWEWGSILSPSQWGVPAIIIFDNPDFQHRTVKNRRSFVCIYR